MRLTKGTAVVRSLPAAAIDEDTNAGDLSSMSPDNIHRFLDPSAARYDVFGYDEPLVRPNLETAPQDQAAGFLFHKNVPFP